MKECCQIKPYLEGDEKAISADAKEGWRLFNEKARCVSCHHMSLSNPLGTDNRFHNIGVGINAIQHQIPKLAREFLKAEATASEVDKKVLTDKRTSELGRFAISRKLDDIGSFKTPTLRNVAKTAPYMHDGSLATLREVMEHYNNGGVTEPGDPVNDFLSSGIRPLNLNDEEIDALVAFMEALTSPEYAQ